MKRKWGVGCWGQSSCSYMSCASLGETVAEAVCLTGGWYVFFRGTLLREKPYASRGRAMLAVEQVLRKERG